MSQKYATYDVTGRIIAFYDRTDSPAPEGVSTVAITDEQWVVLLDGQAQGKRMAVNASGVPLVLDPLPPSRDEVATTKRAARDAALSSTDWLVSRHQDEKIIGNGTTLTADQFAALLKYRQSLREIASATGWPNIDLPVAPSFIFAIT